MDKTCKPNLNNSICKRPPDAKHLRDTNPFIGIRYAVKGDTLFGQLCWAIRNRLGEAYLNQCLEGYNNDQPFAVVSDAFPEHYLPLPKLPSIYFRPIAGEDRKTIKKRCWLPEAALKKPVLEWLSLAGSTAQLAENYAKHKRANIIAE